jgi:hypothetical protein
MDTAAGIRSNTGMAQISAIGAKPMAATPK